MVYYCRLVVKAREGSMAPTVYLMHCVPYTLYPGLRAPSWAPANTARPIAGVIKLSLAFCKPPSLDSLSLNIPPPIHIYPPIERNEPTRGIRQHGVHTRPEPHKTSHHYHMASRTRRPPLLHLSRARECGVGCAAGNMQGPSFLANGSTTES